MAKVLLVVEHRDGKLSQVTTKALNCALQLPEAEVTAVVFAADAGNLAEETAKLSGVKRVLRVEDARHAQPLAALIAPQLAEIAAGYTHVLGPSTTFGRDLMPRVAALLNAPQISDVAVVESANRFRRPICAGNAILTVEVDVPLVVMTVRVASFAPAPAGDGAAPAPAPVEAVQPKTELPTHTRFVSLTRAQSERPDLQSASRVVSGGRAFDSPEAFQKLYKVADLLGAAVGASRAAVDSGVAPNDLQVGQTGKIIAPELYMAFGISGAIQHLTGIKDAGVIVAINKDGDAPIFEVADVGLVADVYAVLEQLEQILQPQ